MRSTRSRQVLTAALALVAPALVLSSSCTKEEAAAPPPPPAQTTAPAPAAPPPPPAETKVEPSTPPAAAPGGGSASISGEVKLEGTPPQMQPLKRGVDPVCAKKPMNDEQVLSRDGKLENVVVWVSEGAPAAGAPPAAPAKLEQIDCMYRPRVQAVQDGQMLEVHNGDKTLHNVRAVRGTKSLFNKAQVPGGPKITETARAGEVMQFKCDVHPWMKAFAVVVPHSYSDVTNESGRFNIKDLPPGKYTVTAWHELFGTKKSEVTIQEGKASPILFVYNVQDRE
ncbi:MAG TPA: carboxypeptidase regulatory-like domain-containing protein [Myxococcales bacterium]|nr:carboxypeptidase regulatory-like domain-containing protein [Myxococcales bacterium]